MGARARHTVVVAAAVVFTLTAARAWAVEWFPPVEGGVITPYGVVCPSGTQHRGVDVAGTADAEVRAPLPGKVLFAGQVPADGGGTCGAVTIELADGRKLSLLPLSETSVSEGANVDPGEPIGTLAAAGDDSAAEAHLHIGLRSGTTYLDPSGLLSVAPIETPVVEPQPSPEAGPPAGADPAAGAGTAPATETAPEPQAPCAAGAGAQAVVPDALPGVGALTVAAPANLTSASASVRCAPHLSIAAGPESDRVGTLIGTTAPAKSPGAMDGSSVTDVPVAPSFRARAVGLAALAAGIGAHSTSLLPIMLSGVFAMAVAVAARRGALVTTR